MTARAHIDIWSDRKVREAFSDCDELFASLRGHSVGELDGVRYHYCYWHQCYYSTDAHYTRHSQSKHRTPAGQQLTKLQMEENARWDSRLTEFVDWLRANTTHWEVSS
jgi:hypothetical protein